MSYSSGLRWRVMASAHASWIPIISMIIPFSMGSRCWYLCSTRSLLGAKIFVKFIMKHIWYLKYLFLSLHNILIIIPVSLHSLCMLLIVTCSFISLLPFDSVSTFPMLTCRPLISSFGAHNTSQNYRPDRWPSTQLPDDQLANNPKPTDLVVNCRWRLLANGTLNKFN